MSLILALSMLAQAAEPPPGQLDAPHRTWDDHQTFIAPSGEPFHAPAGAPYPSAQWFAGADANHDGKLTLAEFTADFMRFFNRLDVNRDGVIDSAELDAYEKVIAPEVHGGGGGGEGGGWQGHQGDHPHGGGGSGGGRGGGGWGGHHRGGEEGEGRGGGDQGGEDSSYHPIGSYGAGRPRGAARFDLLGFPEPVAAMDLNFNGRITREEALEAANQRFDTLDSDHQGYLQIDKLPPTFAQQRKGHGHRPEHRQEVPIPMDDK